ncbi:MAG TPA: glycosyltransferase [Desulfobacterales bacterium]|nr:glycosyltransferase [Desulfobacterales bacterium]
MKVSVVIPAYNHEKFIGPAIDSVLNQSFQDFELIIVDDGSTDKTADVIKGYTDSRIRYFYQENQDAYNTINRGMGIAEGEFVAILNSDDIYSLDRLQRLLDKQQETGAQCLFSDVIPISDSGEDFTDPNFGWNVWHKKNRDFFQDCGDLYAAFLKGNFMVTTSNLFMSSDAVKKVGKFCSLRYLHDYDFIFRMISTFPDQVHYLFKEKLLYYRIHDGNTLGEAAITGREQDKALIQKYMLARVPSESKFYVEAGSDRLIELQQELNDVRHAISDTEPSVSESGRAFLAALKYKIRKKLGQ